MLHVFCVCIVFVCSLVKPVDITWLRPTKMNLKLLPLCFEVEIFQSFNACVMFDV